MDTSKLREQIVNNLLSWATNQGVELDTEQKHSLLYGVVPAILDLYRAHSLQERIEELKNWRARTLLTANDPLNIRVEMESRIKQLEAEKEK